MSRRKKRNSGNGEALSERRLEKERKRVDWSAWVGSWQPEARSTLGDLWPEHARPKRTTDPPELEQ